MLSFIKTKNTIEIILDGAAFSIDSSNSYFNDILSALRMKAPPRELLRLLDIATTIKQSVRNVRVEGSRVFYGDAELDGTMVQRLLDLIDLKLDAQPVIKFIERLMRNPDAENIKDMYDFLEVGRLPITEDGHFLAYKVVRGDYLDKHSGKFDNSPGKEVREERALVDKDRNNTCSRGLHFCSFDYIKHFLSSRGDKIVLVKVDPADVVSIPADYNNTKARCCRYLVVSDVTEQMYPSDKPGDFTGKDILRDVGVATDTGERSKVGIKFESDVQVPAAPKVVDKASPKNADICPDCGSKNHKERAGYSTKNGWKNRRECKDCGRSWSYDPTLPTAPNEKAEAAVTSTGAATHLLAGGDVGQFIDAVLDSVLTEAGAEEATPCPNCGSTFHKEFAAADGDSFKYCNNCHAIFKEDTGG